MSDDEVRKSMEEAADAENPLDSYELLNENKVESPSTIAGRVSPSNILFGNPTLPGNSSSSPLSSANQPKFSELLVRCRDLEAENFRLKVELADLQKFKRYLPKIENKTPTEVHAWITTTINQNAVLQSDKETLEDKYSELSKAFCDLQVEYSDKIENIERDKTYLEGKHEAELNSKNAEIAAYKQEVKQISATLACQEAENVELRRHIPESSYRDIDMRRLTTAEFTQNVDTLSERERDLHDVKAQLNARINEIELIQDQLRDARLEIKDKDREIDSLKSQLAEAQDFAGDPNFTELPSHGKLSMLGLANQAGGDRRSILTLANISAGFSHDDFNGVDLLRLTMASQPGGLRRTTLYRASAENLRHIVNKLFEELRGCGTFIRDLLERLGDYEDVDLTRLIIDFKNRFEDSINYAQDLITASEANCAEAQAAEQEVNMIVEGALRMTIASSCNQQPHSQRATVNQKLEVGTACHNSGHNTEYITQALSSVVGGATDQMFNEAICGAFYQEQNRVEQLSTECTELKAKLAELNAQYLTKDQEKCTGDCASAQELREALERQKTIVNQFAGIQQEVQTRALEAQEQLVEGSAPNLINAIKTMFDKNADLKQANEKLAADIVSLNQKLDMVHAAGSVENVSMESQTSMHTQSVMEKNQYWTQLVAAQEELKQAYIHAEEIERIHADNEAMWKDAINNAEETSLEFSAKYQNVLKKLDVEQRSLEEKNTQLDSLQQQLEEAQYSIEEFQINQEEIDRKHEQLENCISDLQTQNDRLCDVVDDFLGPINKLFESHRIMKLQNRQQVGDTAASSISDISDASNMSNDGNRYLRIMTTRDKTSRKISDLVQRFEANYKNVELLNQRVKELEQSKATMVEAERQSKLSFEDMQRQMESLKEQYESAEKNADTLQRVLQDYANDLEKERCVNGKLHDHVKNLQQQISKRKSSSSSGDFKSKEDRHKSAEAELGRFKTELQAAQTDMNRLAEKHADALNQIEHYKKINAELQQHVDNLPKLSGDEKSSPKEQPQSPASTPPLHVFNKSFESLTKSASLIRRRLMAISAHGLKLRDSIGDVNVRNLAEKFISTADTAIQEVDKLSIYAANAQTAIDVFHRNVNLVTDCERHELIIDYLRGEVDRLESELKSMHESLRNNDMVDIKEALRAQLKRITRTLHTVKMSVTRDPNIREDIEAEQHANEHEQEAYSHATAKQQQNKEGRSFENSPLKELNQ